MGILSEHVDAYLQALRPERSEVMAEMEAIAERDHVPIVHWETGRFLAVLCRSTDPRVLEVGTAIGYSTLHMAEQLSEGRVTTLELDPDRAAQARDLLDRAGVGGRVEIVEGDARESMRRLRSRPSRPLAEEHGRLEGPFDLLFVDAAKDEYAEYIHLAEPLLAERALLVVDNLLMSGEVALPGDAETFWNPNSLAAARELNTDLVGDGRWLGAVLPIGDGVGLAARRD